MALTLALGYSPLRKVTTSVTAPLTVNTRRSVGITSGTGGSGGSSTTGGAGGGGITGSTCSSSAEISSSSSLEAVTARVLLLPIALTTALGYSPLTKATTSASVPFTVNTRRSVGITSGTGGSGGSSTTAGGRITGAGSTLESRVAISPCS